MQTENGRILFRIESTFNSETETAKVLQYIKLPKVILMFIYLKFYFYYSERHRVNCLCATTSTSELAETLIQKRLLLMGSSSTFKINLLFTQSIEEAPVFQLLNH